ncbi:GntR family transcriptional regulator [Streptomyces sp. CA-179760]|uniref:GntR family transcriptional regulator n=1 Tax=Streptomyces sp. CA-179760 TaxID=3240054 RepID=UPI003D8BCBD6
MTNSSNDLRFSSCGRLASIQKLYSSTPGSSPGAAASRRYLLERNLREADEAVERDDRERYAELVQEFHDLLIAGADNSRLEAHYRMLMNQLAYSRLVHTSLGQPGRALQSDREHHVVLELILEKDGDSAEHVMREHARASRRALLAGLLIGGSNERFDGAGS